MDATGKSYLLYNAELDVYLVYIFLIFDAHKVEQVAALQLQPMAMPRTASEPA